MSASSTVILVAPGSAAALFRPFVQHLDGVDGVSAHPHDMLLTRQPFEPGDWTLDAEVVALREYIDSLTDDRVHLVGHSGGGAVALAFASAYVDRLHSLTVAEPPWTGTDHDSQIGFLSDLADVASRPSREAGPAFRDLYVDEPHELGARGMDDASIRMLRAVAAEYPRARSRLDAVDAAGIPVLLAHGTASTPHVVDIVKVLAQRLHRSRVVSVVDGQHFNLWTVGARMLAEVWILEVRATPPR